MSPRAHPLPSPLSNEDPRKLPSLDPERRSSSGSIKIPSISTISGGGFTGRGSGLAALASIASEQIDSSTQLADNMSFATVAPGGANNSGGMAASPPICDNCGTSTTPLWRRSENNTILCNACGLFLKLHNRPRPISLKTDVIKSRNRIRTGGQGQQPKKKSGPESQPSGLAAAHPELSHSTQVPPSNESPYRRTPYAAPDGPAGPSSRSSTPSGYPPQPHHQSNIAPQHYFDGVTMESSQHHGYPSTDSPSFTHGSLPHSNLSAPPRNASPSSSSLLNGSSNHNGVDPYDAMSREIEHLKTRVSELEVINDLYHGRVAELERGEAEAKRALEETLRRLHEANARLDEADRRERGMETESYAEGIENDERKNKRLRMSMSDLIEDPSRNEGEADGQAHDTNGSRKMESSA